MPSPDKLNELEYGKFVLTNLAAERAKDIRANSAPLVRTPSNHPLSIALAEIAAGKIKPILGSKAQLILESDDTSFTSQDVMDAGIALPGVEFPEELEKLADEELDEVEEYDDDEEDDEDGVKPSLGLLGGDDLDDDESPESDMDLSDLDKDEPEDSTLGPATKDEDVEDVLTEDADEEEVEDEDADEESETIRNS